jgi:hypothetical protein
VEPDLLLFYELVNGIEARRSRTELAYCGTRLSFCASIPKALQAFFDGDNFAKPTN